MEKYLGYVVIVSGQGSNSVFYNFQLSHRMVGSNFEPLSDIERGEILPDSQRKEINLYFDYYRGEEAIMDEYYQEEAFYVIELEEGDLEDNMKNQTEKNSTGYKLAGLRFIENGKIYPLEQAGFISVIQDEEVKKNFFRGPIVLCQPVQPDHHIANWEHNTMVQLDGFYAGPYLVEYRTRDSAFFIRPELEENKQLVWGFQAGEVNLITITAPLAHRHNEELSITVVPYQPEKIRYLDVISPEIILEGFKESMQSGGFHQGTIEVNQITGLLEQYRKSLLVGEDVPPDSRERRLHMLEDLLSSQGQLDSTLRRITDYMTQLLEENKKHPKVEEFFALLGGGAYSASQSEETKKQIDLLQDEKSRRDEEITALVQKLEEEKENTIEVTQRAIELHLQKTDADYNRLQQALSDLQQELSSTQKTSELLKSQESLTVRVGQLEENKKALEENNLGLEEAFDYYLEKSRSSMLDIAFNGLVSHKMMTAAAKWEMDSQKVDYQDSIDAVDALSDSFVTSRELIAYLVETVQVARPDYHENTILNIAICITQGFLTVFSGEPGCGKTSICQIMAQVLGLTRFRDMTRNSYQGATDLNRYVQISVERGWTSKRDFVGYFNPLSKNFDKTNSKMYDALKLLDMEEQQNASKFPLLVLLDEANLSPMEYYWADFMNICDDLDENSEINLGEEHVFTIPETLHFLATINNDHTTEMLSPRLIDRSWVIKLPSGSSWSVNGAKGRKLQKGEIKLVSWETLEKAFVPDKVDTSHLSHKAIQVQEQLKQRLQEMKIPVSPRTELAMGRYLTVAGRWMQKGEFGEDSSLVAMDYAVAQRILPKIVGSGDEFREQLDSLCQFCKKEELTNSTQVLEEIIAQGDKQMKYYQFF